ncbi:MAG: helix-turn-helix domain-containing protein [Atopostipes suicloacalis]|nr:helix-turn-helix domain-containing protein [Atopostipes suicloacalis]
MDDLGTLFRLFRKERGFTLKDLSEGIVSYSYLSKFENGKAHISLHNFTQLIQRMNLTVDEVLYFNQMKANDYTEFFQAVSLAYAKQNIKVLKKHLENSQVHNLV